VASSVRRSRLDHPTRRAHVGRARRPRRRAPRSRSAEGPSPETAATSERTNRAPVVTSAPKADAFVHRTRCGEVVSDPERGCLKDRGGRRRVEPFPSCRPRGASGRALRLPSARGERASGRGRAGSSAARAVEPAKAVPRVHAPRAEDVRTAAFRSLRATTTSTNPWSAGTRPLEALGRVCRSSARSPGAGEPDEGLRLGQVTSPEHGERGGDPPWSDRSGRSRKGRAPRRAGRGGGDFAICMRRGFPPASAPAEAVTTTRGPSRRAFSATRVRTSDDRAHRPP